MENRQLTSDQTTELLHVLKKRFEENQMRHKEIVWKQVEERLLAKPEKLWSLYQMEQSGGEPDVIGQSDSGEVKFMDCAKESPKGRRSLCYDRGALEARKQHKPASSAWDMAYEMGVEIASEEDYRYLQTLGEFDLKTSSWIDTPEAIRHLGGALFCDRRYNAVFTYHNGADSYYASRGFRAVLYV